MRKCGSRDRKARDRNAKLNRYGATGWQNRVQWNSRAVGKRTENRDVAVGNRDSQYQVRRGDRDRQLYTITTGR